MWKITCPDPSSGLGNDTDNLYDLDNVPDNLYDLDNVPKAEGLRCVRILENIAREWQNLDEKMPRDSAKDQTMERLNSQPKEV